MLLNPKRCKLGFIVGLLSTAFLQSSCSSVPETQRTDRRDPYEGANRGAFAFNMGLDTHVLEPAASAYKNTIPKTGQRAIENHLNWAGLHREMYLFVAVVFFFCCYGMSLYSGYLERKLDTENKFQKK